ncbi:hypothetical protein B0H17DRAFT_1061588, partial [Mycena rosella]
MNFAENSRIGIATARVRAASNAGDRTSIGIRVSEDLGRVINAPNARSKANVNEAESGIAVKSAEWWN